MRYLVRAAGRARRALAFNRAARLYGDCFVALPPSSPRRYSIAVKGADALAHAGRSLEAADAYLVAATVAATPLDALELKQRAAGQLLGCGALDRGLVLVHEVMSAQGLRFAKTSRGALVSIVADQLRRVVRGYRFRERPESELSREQLMRIDTCWSVSVALGQIDTLRGFDCQSQHMFLALEAGELVRITLALAFEAATLAAMGVREKTDKLQRRVDELAARIDDPHTHAMVAIAGGVREHVLGNWRVARELLEKATRIVATRSTDVSWEIAFTNFYLITSLGWTGDIAELRRCLPRFVAQVEARGNLYAATLYQIGMSCFAGLAEDAPERTEAHIAEASRKWLPQGFYLQNLLAAYARVHLQLYQGRAAEAFALADETLRSARRAFLLRAVIARIDGLILRARAALAMVDAGEGDERRLLTTAFDDATAVHKLRQPWGQALALPILAAVAQRRGRPEECLALLTRGAEGLRAGHMMLFAQATEHRRGELLGGEEGRAIVEGAEAFMREQTIVRPDRMLATITPGFRAK